MDNNFYENAIFLGGHRRSGTTLLMHLLENHPQLCVFPADSGFFYAYFPVYESVEFTNKDRVKRVIDFCYSNLKEEIDKVNSENVGEEILEFPFDALHMNFQKKALNSNITTKEILIAMISAYRETYHKNLSKHKAWVEKTSSSEIYAKYIFEWFQRAKFIHILRDPRDIYSSLKSGWNTYYKERGDDIRLLMQSMIDRGKLSIELAQFNLNKYGEDRYMIIKYEELTSKTVDIMRRISEFLGIEYNKCLLQPTACGKLWQGNNFNKMEFTKTSTVNVGRWKERITEEETKLIEFHFQDVMNNYGYKPAYETIDCIDAVVEHYKWYNYARPYRV